MKKLIPVVFFLALMLVSVQARSEEFDPSKIRLDDLSPGQAESLLNEYKQEINQNLSRSKLPDFLVSLFGNETVNVYITTLQGKQWVMGVKLKDMQVQAFQQNGFANQTLNVFASEADLKEIVLAEDSMSAFMDALNKGVIRYEGVGLAGLKFTVIGIIQKIMAFFSSLFPG